MAVDLTIQMINATVQIDQPLPDGKRTVGTGFLVQAPTSSGAPRVVLVTAAHVFDRMPGAEARVAWRFQGADAVWRRQPQPVQIRAFGEPLWIKHPKRDVVAMEIAAPREFAEAAIPLSWLADDSSFDSYRVGPSDEMMALGYPEGQSANAAGFPILRVGRVASYPLTPIRQFPTFMLDFRVFAGNSGGPVFMTTGLRRGPQAPTEDPPQLVVGMLTQQGWVGDKALELGIVTHASFIRETIALLDRPRAAPQPRASPPESRPQQTSPPAAATPG